MGSSVELQSWACWGRYGFDARNLQTLSRQNSGTLRDATFSLQVYGRSSTSFETPSRPESLLRGPGFHDLQSGRTRCLLAQAVRCQWRTTTNAEMTYTGLYFYGVNTYFEFFDIASSPSHLIGDSSDVDATVADVDPDFPEGEPTRAENGFL